jgi:NitT/TauT family transport system substrate-binding protein
LAPTWKAEAEHGGFYQAIAAGIYKKYGLDVTLRQGGPQVNHAQLLAAGALDFNLSSNSFGPLNYVQQSIPMVAVAAIFQKDPAVLIAHPNEGNDSLAALKGKPIMISGATRTGSWLFLKEEIRLHRRSDPPLQFQRRAVSRRPQSGPAGLSVERALYDRASGVKPVVLLLADAGYATYGALIQTSLEARTTIPTSFSASSMPASRAGTVISTAIRRRATI